jgi:hypothetical protein
MSARASDNAAIASKKRMTSHAERKDFGTASATAVETFFSAMTEPAS